MRRHSEEAIFSRLSEAGQRLSQLSARHPLLVDLALATGIAAVSLAGLYSQDRLGSGSAVFAVALCAPLLLRRRSAILSLLVIAAIAFLQWLLSAPQLADSSVLFALYWAAREASAAQVAVAISIAEAGAVMAALRWSPSDPVKIWVGLSGLTVAAAVLGITVRQRSALLLSLQEKAARLELERDREGRLGAVAERARIAREMHDIVSHNLTVMIALADGATYAMEASPDQALPAVQRISTTGRQALLEMRRLLGVLRDEPAEQPLEPQPSLARLDDLLAHVKAAGIPVSMEIDGDPQLLSEGVQLTIYRVAQEALTNTLKHANEPTHAHLVLRCGSGRVELELTDNGRELTGVTATLPSADAASVGGRGLRGMRERAAAYGGELEAGPCPGGGWLVRLQLDADVPPQT